MGDKLELPIYYFCDGEFGCDCRLMRRKLGIRMRGNHPAHGERRMYQKGCRCEKCEIANNAYLAGYAAGRKERKKEKTDGNFEVDRAA